MDSVLPVTSYLDHVPAVLREDPILVGIVRAFEAILGGTGAVRGPRVGVEQQLVTLHRFFTPGPGRPAQERAPDEFLPWLAGWVALGLRDDWDPETRRRFVANALSLYRMRGTRQGLAAAIELFLDLPGAVTIREFEDLPHFFQVELDQRTSDPYQLARTDRIVRAIIEQEKPAHTVYGLKIRFPTMQIVDEPARPDQGVHVGVNTLLGVRAFTR